MGLAPLNKKKKWVLPLSRHGKGRVRVRLNELRVKIGHFKRIKKRFGLIGLQVSQVDPYFPHKYFFFYKENMYLPFRKSCSTLLDVKCNTLNSPLIPKMNSVKLINTY